MSFITVHELVELLGEMIVKGEISEDGSIVDALIFDNGFEELCKIIESPTLRNYYRMDEDIPDGALYLRIRSKNDSEYDTAVIFYTTKEETSTK